MEILRENFWWMVPNLALASVGFFFALGCVYFKNRLVKIPLFILWILFLPNTIYLITDFTHILPQLSQVIGGEQILLFIQYGFLIIFGILCYFIGMAPMEQFFNNFPKEKSWRFIFAGKKNRKGQFNYVFILLNFAIGLAVVLGKIERTHSWYVFTQPMRVVEDIIAVVTTPWILIFAFGFGLFLNIVYFNFRHAFSKIK